MRDRANAALALQNCSINSQFTDMYLANQQLRVR